MKNGLFSIRTYISLLLLGTCVVLLFYISANCRKRLRADNAKPSICSLMEYNKNMGVHSSISSTAQLPLRELLEEKTGMVTTVESTLCTCNRNAGATVEYLYWHTPQGNNECLFEQEKVLVCGSCGALRKRYPTEQLRHTVGDDSLPGICPGD